MITDKQRREVAQELRRMNPEWIGMGWQFHLKSRLGINAIIQVTDGDPRTVSNALADLIEPEPERTCCRIMRGLKNAPGFVGGFCSECEHPINEGAVYCEHCGAKVVS